MTKKARKPLTDEEVEAWPSQVVEDAKIVAKSILQEAQQCMGDLNEARKQLRSMFPLWEVSEKDLQEISSMIPVLLEQLGHMKYTPLEIPKARNDVEKDTAATSTFGNARISFRAAFYRSGVVQRAMTIIHELCHIVGKHIVHTNDTKGWRYNAYRWELIIRALAGYKDM
jgi:hypothetical protein